jgi:abequosyltransferase
MTQPVSGKRLSVCIPTHHGRGETLREAIESVLSQLTETLSSRIEICISDNASEDETQPLVRRYMQEYPGLIRYHRNPENLGFTRNLMHAVGLAEGDFCWLLSSDDVMAPHGLTRILEVLDEFPTLTGLTFTTQAYDRTMTQKIKAEYPPSLLPQYPQEMHVYSGPDQIFRECGSVMGYTSTQVFDRRLWQECLAEIGPEKFAAFTYFPYLYLFGKMVRKKPQWIWLPEKLVFSRADNDYLSSHLSSNMLKYHRLTMEEASQVWGQLFGRGSATYQSLMRDNYVNFWSGPSLLRYKAFTLCTAAEEWRALLWFPRRLYFLPSFWLFAFPVLLTPHSWTQAAAFTVKKLGMRDTLRSVKQRFFPV